LYGRRDAPAEHFDLSSGQGPPARPLEGLREPINQIARHFTDLNQLNEPD
jgi:hypothetical protein